MKEIIDQAKISIYDFNDFRSYLVRVGMPDGLYSHTGKNLKSWANRLGYKSPSSLTMVLRGQRLPSYEMLNALAIDLKLDSKERRYLELLVNLEKIKTKKKDPQLVLKELESLNDNLESKSLAKEDFSLISEWYFIVLKQLIDTPDFIEDEEWIYQKLRKKVAHSKITNALNLLEKLKITKRDDNHNLVLNTKGLITANDIADSAVKRHHYAMLTRASEAIDEQDVEQRQINSVTMKLDKKQLPQAKKFIYDFIKEFNNKFSTQDSSQVMQLNVQFFKHTNDLINN